MTFVRNPGRAGLKQGIELYTALRHASARPAPSERGILMSGPMVRALLMGRKSQTRRIDTRSTTAKVVAGARVSQATLDEALTSPYGPVGTRLYVRETWKVGTETERGGACEVVYRADGHRVHANQFTPTQNEWLAERWMSDTASMKVDKYHDDKLRWRPAIHMPRWLARIHLEITGLRVEAVQEISEADVEAEGTCIRHNFTKNHVTSCSLHAGVTGARHCFATIWDELNQERGYGWLENPDVVVVEFPVKAIKGKKRWSQIG